MSNNPSEPVDTGLTMDIIWVQEATMAHEDTHETRNYIFHCEKNTHNSGTEFCDTHLEQTFTRYNLFSDRMSNLILRGWWHDIVITNAHSKLRIEETHGRVMNN
jgi:hypothetical protein